MDEWQIGILGMPTGFALFFTGGGQYSLDKYIEDKKIKLTQHKFYPFIASGILPNFRKAY